MFSDTLSDLEKLNHGDYSKYRVFIKYCVYSKILKYIPVFGLSRYFVGVSECTQWQVKHQHCSRTGRVQKHHNILRKTAIYNEHPVGKTFSTNIDMGHVIFS